MLLDNWLESIVTTEPEVETAVFDWAAIVDVIVTGDTPAFAALTDSKANAINIKNLKNKALKRIVCEAPAQ